MSWQKNILNDQILDRINTKKPIIFHGDSDIEMVATRDAYGKAMLELGRTDSQVVALNADLESSVRLTDFRKQYPRRSFQIGVAEQNMASIATGLALYGKIPFLSSFAAFSPGLNFSQIRLACISQANITIASSHYGLHIGADGVTAQMLVDLSLMRSLPGLTIITPVDKVQAYQAVLEVTKFIGPTYLRFSRAKFPTLLRSTAEFRIGKAQILREGKDITIIATGSTVHLAVQAAQLLENIKIDVRVINMHTIKPLDKESIMQAADETKAIITIEEHQIDGGLGSAVSEIVSENNSVSVYRLGLQDQFGETGKHEELWKKHRLTVEKLLETVKEALWY